MVAVVELVVVGNPLSIVQRDRRAAGACNACNYPCDVEQVWEIRLGTLIVRLCDEHIQEIAHATGVTEQNDEEYEMYETIEDLMAGYDQDEISADATMYIDNDTIFMYDGDEKIFEMHPNDLMIDLLEYLQIPNEGV